MSDLVNKLNERVENLSMKHIVLGVSAAFLILIILLTSIYFMTRRPVKITPGPGESATVSKSKEKPSVTSAELKPEPKKEETVKEETISIDDARKMNAEIMKSSEVSEGPLDDLSKFVKESEELTKKKEAEHKSKPESKNGPVVNPYNISKSEDLGVLINSINTWNEEQIKDYEDKKKAAKKK